ncbi:hypothetical protein KPH14_000873 [Odynerus spinipes]|uniref:SAP domain-containing protein n=1 Tax=Odynerus spinipes TaxID=1348599 RepID=A0AAD9VHZ6_9HYME|nr:hypothetical protein KPH14_000873 [Odynerus spinipes]
MLPTDFKVSELKQKCSSLGLATTGTKPELISRLLEADLDGNWMLDSEEHDRTVVELHSEVSDEGAAEAVSFDRRELEFAKQRAELAERELAVMRREMELLCSGQKRSQPVDGPTTSRTPMRTEGVNDLVAIKRTQSGPGLKFAPKYFGPYEVVRCLRNNRYVVRKVGEHEGPAETSTVVDHMKDWTNEIDN